MYIHYSSIFMVKSNDKLGYTGSTIVKLIEGQQTKKDDIEGYQICYILASHALLCILAQIR